MKKTGRFFITMYIASLVLFCIGLVCYFGKFLVLPAWAMIATGVVLCITYGVIPELCAKKADYAPTPRSLWIWILLFLYDLFFMGLLIFLWVGRMFA